MLNDTVKLSMYPAYRNAEIALFPHAESILKKEGTKVSNLKYFLGY